MKLKEHFTDDDEKKSLVSCEHLQPQPVSKPPLGVRTWLSARYLLAYLAFFGFVNVYAMRVNLSVAIVSMVNSTDAHVETSSNQSLTDETCPKDSRRSNYTEQNGEFNWNSREKGLVLGAFFYGYITTQILGGYLGSRYGGKWLLGVGVFFTSIFTILTPVAARQSIYLLIAMRVFEGMAEGLTFPAMHALWGVWAPPIDRSRLVSISLAGCSFGTVLAQAITGFLCKSNILGGWPSAYYLFGIAGLLWSFLWMVLTANSPRLCKCISQQEVIFIEENTQVVNNASEKISPSSVIPWKEIMLSKPVWANNIAHFSNNYGFYTLLTSLPLYLNDVLGLDITMNGVISALPYLLMGISMNFAGIIADKVQEKGWLNTTQTRKVFHSISAFGPALFLIVIGFVGCSKVAAIACICIATTLLGFQFSAFMANHIDLSPRYAGILMGISNTWGTIPGFVSPSIVGLLTGKKPTRQNWAIVFYISAAIYIFGALMYLLLASGEKQEWDCSKESIGKNEQKEE